MILGVENGLRRPRFETVGNSGSRARLTLSSRTEIRNRARLCWNLMFLSTVTMMSKWADGVKQIPVLQAGPVHLDRSSNVVPLQTERQQRVNAVVK